MREGNKFIFYGDHIKFGGKNLQWLEENANDLIGLADAHWDSKIASENISIILQNYPDNTYDRLLEAGDRGSAYLRGVEIDIHNAFINDNPVMDGSGGDEITMTSIVKTSNEGDYKTALEDVAKANEVRIAFVLHTRFKFSKINNLTPEGI